MTENRNRDECPWHPDCEWSKTTVEEVARLRAQAASTSQPIAADVAGRVFSEQDKLDAIKREIGYRKFVYPKLTASGKLTKHKADREIAVMEAIARDYDVKAKSERLI